VGVLVGVAVAYFLTEAKFGGNTATGGQLSVTSDLPLNFTNAPLYPVNNPGGATAGAAIQTFTIDNTNKVKVAYKLYADCAECVLPAGATASQAQADKINQFDNLWVNISNASGATGAATYDGLLKNLTADKALDLGEIGNGKSATYTVKLWLKNDSGQAQPQKVLNSWEFFIGAKTPKNGPTTTTTLLP
jgi:hypothetical protein